MEVEKKNEELDKSVIDRNAHDIKNQLMIIMSMANNINNITADEEIKKYSYFIKETAFNCRYMLSEIGSDMNEEIQENNKLINMHYVLSSLLDSFCMEKDIEFTEKMKAGNPRIYANKVFVINAVYNVLLNAVQAIDCKGKIKIKTYNKKKNPNLCYDCTQWLYIEIADSGQGIDIENKDKVFDENYTTKKNKRGLGLFSAKSTIEKCNGTINIKSIKGEGATFIICLPCHVE